jgi:DNA (cytosine-5)-methyltransferase 1
MTHSQIARPPACDAEPAETRQDQPARQPISGATCFSGIGAPETAAPWIDWLWSAEIEAFPTAALAERHPESLNLGDVLANNFLDRAAALGPVSVLVGGPPCQAFSVAGLRQSLSDARGNLSLRWVQIIHAIGPVCSLTENVPGWLSTDDNAFGCFLGALVGSDDALCSPLDGGRWPRAGMVAGPRARAAWRVLDAQYFGVARRRAGRHCRRCCAKP